MASFDGIVFNGVQNPNFMKVRSIVHSALPPISSSTITVPGRAGSIDLQRNVIAERRIDVEILIISQDKNMLPKQLELLSKWLFHKEAKELVLGDNPNRKYYAKLDGNTDFSEILRVGQGTISFICTDPFIYGADREVVLPDLTTQEIVSVINNGNQETPPIIELNVVEKSTLLGVVTNQEFVELGQSQTVDEQKPPYDPRVLHETCRSLDGWVPSAGIFGGTVTEQPFQVGTDNERFEPQNGFVSETEISEWYGPAMQKELSSPTQNFTCQVNFRFRRQSDKEKNGYGKLTFVLRDENNNDVTTIRIYDNRGAENCLLVEWGMIQPGIKTEWVFTNINPPNDVQEWFGHFDLKRRGNFWTVAVYEDNRGRSRLVAQKNFSDSANKYNNKIKHFQVGFLRFEKRPVNYMAFTHVTINSQDPQVTENKGLEYIVFPGDKILINNQTGKVYKNNGLMLGNLNPSSTFIKLESGLNNIGFYPSGIVNGGKITFKERY